MIRLHAFASFVGCLSMALPASAIDCSTPSFVFVYASCGDDEVAEKYPLTCNALRAEGRDHGYLFSETMTPDEAEELRNAYMMDDYIELEVSACHGSASESRASQKDLIEFWSNNGSASRVTPF